MDDIFQIERGDKMMGGGGGGWEGKEGAKMVYQNNFMILFHI